MMLKTNYNPDVLTCLANLSNDEVFTPPKLVNDILDILPQKLFTNKNTTFLDPVSKSGVFLRETAKRLMESLESEIPDKQERVSHIFKNQIFGIAITELTSLLSRRSVYCSKTANGKYSVCETYAYQFIHTDKPKNIFNMKFDVIIGNPPYQMSDGGGRDSGAISLYHKFVQQAKKLNPRYLSMIIPARWYSGGKGLSDFRKEMLNDKRMAEIHDFPETSDCFPRLNIRGGVCYFLWDKEHNSDCKVTNYKSGLNISRITRPLLEVNVDIFIRYNRAISILRKVKKLSEPTYSKIVSSRKPFGIQSNFTDFSNKQTFDNKIKIFKVGGIGFTNEANIINGKELTDKIKVLVSKASPGGDDFPHKIISSPIIAKPKSCCTETYLVVDVVLNFTQAKNLCNYMSTSFFRFMMSLVKNTQNISKSVFEFVPIQNLDEEWSDKKLYTKYNITKDEQNFIDTLIRPMKL